MKSKKIHYVLLLTFILFSGFVVRNQSNQNIGTSNQSVSEMREKGFVVYYFHNSKRCVTCRKIESYTRKVFEQNFQDKYTFKSINVDESRNRHFINDYSLYTKSVVLVKFDEDGNLIKFNNLPGVWDNIRSEERFKSYIKAEMENFLM